jgi:predicted acyl esterase
LLRPVVGLLLLAAIFASSGTARSLLPPCVACTEREDVSLRMDDGVTLAATVYLPAGTPPAGGWPGVMLLHGLGGTRADMAPIATGFLVNQGYAVLAYDARGHGESGGVVTLDGPRELQDVRTAFAWFTGRADVSDTQIGAMGFSYGGGAVLRAAVDGVPFRAIVPVITWTNLYDALLPQDLAKSGAVVNFLQSVTRWDPSVYALAQEAIQSTNLSALRTFAAGRSSLPGLVGLKTPTFFIQGRRDFAFDLRQARTGFKAVAGPERLYIGDLGHAPATNPAAERPHYLTEAREWFDRWLKGVPNGIDTRPTVELAPDPWTGRTYSYRGFPRTTLLGLGFRFGGTRTIAAGGKAVRTGKSTRKRLETFWGGSVRVKLASSTGWPHVVAVLSALTRSGTEIVVSEGGTLTPGLTQQSRFVTIRLIDTATVIPRGSRLRLTLASSSTAQNIGDLLYLDVGMPQSARLTIGAATLRLPVLRRPVSR